MTATTSRSRVALRTGTLASALLVVGGLLPPPASGQGQPVVIVGRIVDAVSREPVSNALVLSADSSVNVFADSLGNFAIPLTSTPPYIVLAEQFGYELTTFELPTATLSRLYVLPLEPTPLDVDGITVVGESELATLVRRLEGRRRGYSGSLRVFDAESIAREGSGTAMDLLRRRVPGARPCFGQDGLCRFVRGQNRAIMVCIDDFVSWSPTNDLESIPLEEVFLAEFYGATMAVGLQRRAGVFQGGGTGRGVGSAGQIRVYTRRGILYRASGGGRGIWPVEFGC